jgi:DNA-binding MltR family transcriptional regulator
LEEVVVDVVVLVAKVLELGDEAVEKYLKQVVEYLLQTKTDLMMMKVRLKMILNFFVIR